MRKVPHVWCKECCKILYKEIRNKNKDKWTKSSIDPYLVNVEKKCSDCKTKQSRIQFNKDRTTRDGLSYHSKNCSKNRYKNNNICGHIYPKGYFEKILDTIENNKTIFFDAINCSLFY